MRNRKKEHIRYLLSCVAISKMPHCILIRDRPEFSADTSKYYSITFVRCYNKVEISEQNAEIAYMGRVQISKPEQTKIVPKIM